MNFRNDILTNYPDVKYENFKFKSFIMKKLSYFLCGFLFLGFTLSANTINANNPLVGDWVFSVSQVPWEYSRGNMVFEVQSENIVAGKMKFVNGLEARLVNVTQADEKYTFVITAEGYSIKTIVTLKDDDLTGYIETPEGNIPFSAKRGVPES